MAQVRQIQIEHLPRVAADRVGQVVVDDRARRERISGV
jgi:hypothetical protein